MNTAAAPYSPTAPQMGLLRFIAGYMEASDGVAPSFREMMPAVGVTSTNGIYQLLDGLEERGLIRRLPFKHRAIQIVTAPAIPRDVAGAPLYFMPIETPGLSAPAKEGTLHVHY